MSSNDNQEIAKRFLDALDRRDVPELKACITDDFEFKVMAQVSPIGPFKGKRGFDELEALLGKVTKGRANFTYEYIFGEGDLVAAALETNARTFNDKLYANRTFFLLRFRGDKIAEVREYTDTEYAHKVFAG
jgi:ketosteroid isomerase-like protein